MSKGDVIEFSHVGLSFGSFVVHRDISFSIRNNEVVTILGPSGSGKTMILKLIIGLIKPTSGRVSVGDEDISKMNEAGLRKVRKRIGMLFQGAALFDSLSVFENIAYSLRETDTFSEAEIKNIVYEKLRLVGLPDIQDKYPSSLSGGQRKRVGLARALASSPDVVLFDEPTTGLDPTSRRRIDDLILTMKEELGITSIVVTHDIDSAKRISDRWILINSGQIAADGSVTELIETNQDISEFVSGNWHGEA